jgi:CheY-like chemotaxis protein
MVILGQNELLLESGLCPAAEKRARAVMSSAQRAADLTRQLLAFGRKQTLQPSIVRLADSIHQVTPMLDRLLGADIDMKAVLAEELWQISIDRSQLEQVLINLAVNARDAMPSGGTLTIETSNLVLGSEYAGSHPVVAPGEYVMLAISDTGTGIPAEVREHIFEPFFTTKPEGKGTGLGLSTVYGIVKQSGGYIWVYSELNEGTTFKLYFPRSTDAETPQTPITRADQKAPIGPKTILLVEDDQSLSQVVTEFLGAEGHTVLTAESEDEGVKVALENRARIDLVLTDVIIKGGNGKRLREQLVQAECRVPFLFMSGYTPASIVHHGILDAGTHFLQKPFTRSTLLREVDACLRNDQNVN